MLQQSENSENSLYQAGCILNSVWIIHAYLSLSFLQILLKNSTLTELLENRIVNIEPPDGLTLSVVMVPHWIGNFLLTV